MRESSGSRQPRRILVVDDDQALANMIAQVLQDEGYDVVCCCDSREARQQVLDLHPSALVLDVVMPNMDGWSVLREVRKEPHGKDLPVVLMSAAWRPQEKQREIGTTHRIAPTVSLPKPFELSELDRCLR